MLKRLTLATTAAIALTTAGLFAAEYDIDHTHSFVQFKVSHLGVSYVIGNFDVTKGSFTFDGEGSPADQSINIEVSTASLDTNHAERNKHLADAEYLNVAEYPTASFKSTGYEGDAEGGVMKGDLTLFGTTKPIDVMVRKIGEGKDPWGGYRAGFEGKVTITPADFGITYNLGPTANTVELNIIIEGQRK